MECSKVSTSFSWINSEAIVRFWGFFLLIFAFTSFSGFSYATVISKLLPPTGNYFISAVQNDRFQSQVEPWIGVCGWAFAHILSPVTGAAAITMKARDQQILRNYRMVRVEGCTGGGKKIKRDACADELAVLEKDQFHGYVGLIGPINLTQNMG